MTRSGCYYCLMRKTKSSSPDSVPFIDALKGPRLPYPTVQRGTRNFPSEEYVIPPQDREKVLKQMWLYVDPPVMDAVMIDIHCDKRFVVSEYKVVRESGRNLLVSPYYYESGGTIIDWWPVDGGDDDEVED